MIEDKEKFIEQYMSHTIFTIGPSTREMIRDLFLNHNKLYLFGTGTCIDVSDDQVAEVAYKLGMICYGAGVLNKKEEEE